MSVSVDGDNGGVGGGGGGGGDSGGVGVCQTYKFSWTNKQTAGYEIRNRRVICLYGDELTFASLA